MSCILVIASSRLERVDPSNDTLGIIFQVLVMCISCAIRNMSTNSKSHEAQRLYALEVIRKLAVVGQSALRSVCSSDPEIFSLDFF